MRFPRTVLLSILAVITSTGLAAAQAQSDLARKLDARLQAAGEKIIAACGADVKTYCGNVTPGEGRIVLCMMAHEDKISTKCDYALYEASRNLDRALSRIETIADACWDDVAKMCGNVPEGGGRIAGCLMQNKSKASRRCQATLAKVPAPK
jgi:hypothetical protein